MNEKLKRYFDTIRRINEGLEVSDEDLQFFLETSPDIDENKINQYLKDQKDGKSTPEQEKAALIEATRKVQSDPVFKERIFNIATSAKSQKASQKLSDGINLVLAGTDIANSINQITSSKQAARKSNKPGRPGIPQRDVMLQQALRSAEQGTFDSERAIAPARAEIQNQYLNDIQNAKTASTGQAGQFGAYAQVAANRRNQASMQLAPMADQVKAREQQRYDNLLGMRMDETQRMFGNQANMYENDLYQYGKDQDAIAALGSTGQANLRGSLQNFGNQVAPMVGNYYTQQKYRNLKNRASAAYDQGLSDKIVKAHQNLDSSVGNPELWNEMYTGY
jgi:hypothetical protein